MGILSIHRNLLSNCKSQLKHLSPSSNMCFICRISSPSGLSSKAQSHAPTADLKSNNKLMFLIEHFPNESGTFNARGRLRGFPPYNYSLIYADISWKRHLDIVNPFTAFGKYILVGSCNKQMLLFLYNMVAPFFDGDGEYLLWNTTTMEFKILPPPGPAFKHKHGFRFDSESEDYKVVRFPFCGCDYATHEEEEIDNEVQLYSLKTNSWKKIGYPRCGEPLQKPSVYVNGVYYWETIIWRTCAIILSFDFATEKFSSPPYIPRPPKFDVHSKGLFVDDFILVEYDGSLAALVHSEIRSTEKPFRFEVWGWNGKSWNERVPRMTIDGPGGVVNGVVKVVGLFQNDKLFLQGFNNGELMLFDLEKRKLENFGIRADPERVKIFPYYGSSSIPSMGNK